MVSHVAHPSCQRRAVNPGETLLKALEAMASSASSSSPFPRKPNCVVFHKITTAPLPPPKGAAPRGDAVPMGASQPHAWEREPELGDTPKFHSCPPCSLGCDSLLPGVPLSICFPFHGGEMLWNRVKPWAGQQGPAPRSFFCGQAKDIAYGKQ